MSIPQTFGLVATATSLLSFYLAATTQPSDALFVSWLAWGIIFFLLGIALFVFDRLFHAGD